MLKGDLSSTTLASVLLDLAADGASGSLTLRHPEGPEAQIFMRSGLVCGIYVPDRHSDLGAKLVSSGILEPEALADAQEAQRTDLAAWNLGELLVHLGYVEQDVVQGFVIEQLHEALWDLMRWTDGSWKFRKNAKTREDVGPPMTVVDLLESLRERGYEWETIAEIVDSPNAVPMLSARGDGAPETTLDSDAWSMLCKIDGTRTVADLATDCGYTLFEAGQVLVSLVDAGLVDIGDDSDSDDGGEDVYGAAAALAGALSGPRTGSNGSNGSGSGSNGSGGGSDDALSRLARLATEVTATQPGTSAPTTNPLQLDVMAAQLSGANLTVPISRKSGESFAAAMDRVAGALVDALGPPPEVVEEDQLVVRRPRPRTKRAEESIDLDEQRRRRRAAAAAELAEAQAAVESLRPDRRLDEPVNEAPPRLVDLEAERARVAAREAEEAARHATEGAAREAAERFAREVTEQAARIQLEQAEREARAQEADEERRDAERLAAEQLAAEEAERDRLAMAAEQAQREAAQRAAEEAARIAAERTAAEAAAKRAAEEAARIAAERTAAEEAARIAAEQLAAETAAREAAEEVARIAAEQLAAETAAREAAAREAAEQEASEAAAREAAEQEAAEAAAREAAEQAAAEEQAEAERRAQEEADRRAREEAARQAAEAAEAVRVAQEAEARAALAAAQAEADARAEAARVAQEAAELAAAKAAAEESERVALQEAIAQSQHSDDAAAATAMLVELHHTAEPAVVPAPEEPAAAHEPEPEPEPVPEHIPARLGPFDDDADTAALLRELSSLGLEDSDRPSLAAATPPPRAPRPTQADKKAKKKIGLFGL